MVSIQLSLFTLRLSLSSMGTGWPAISNLMGDVHNEVTEMQHYEIPADFEVSLNCNNSNNQHLYMSNTSLCRSVNVATFLLRHKAITMTIVLDLTHAFLI